MCCIERIIIIIIIIIIIDSDHDHLIQRFNAILLHDSFVKEEEE